MKYFKNTELAKLYNVSEKSVRNWIQASQDGKLDLQLYLAHDKYHVANTPKNALVIETLAVKGRKYKNSRALKVVTPRSELYKVCTPRQIYDLYLSIDLHREIPHKYSYLNGGAKHWDRYSHKLLREKTSNSVTNTIQLLDLNERYITALASEHAGINVIDLGVGNCLTVKELLGRLLDQSLLNKYSCLDISEEMLEIASSNIRSWFGEKIQLECRIRDFNYERFEDLALADAFSPNDKSIMNLVFFFGGTISNLRDPDQTLLTIKNSLGKNDVFMLSRKLDTAATRRFFDFTIDTDPALEMSEKYMLDLLGISESYYDIEQFFDASQRARLMQAKLRVDLSIRCQINGKQHQIEIRKGEGLTIWRSDHQTLQETINNLDRNGFDVLQAVKSYDKQYALFISKVKS